MAVPATRESGGDRLRSPTHILDADVVIGRLRGALAAVTRLDEIRRRGILAVASITLVEIYAGMRPQEERPTESFLQTLRRCDISLEIARKAGEYLRRYRHQGVTPPDAIVAATALLNHLEVVTFNSRHYPMPEVRLYRP